MIALTSLLIRDYVRSWKVALELILLVIFLNMGVLQKDQPTENLMAIGLFSLFLIPIVSLRLSGSTATVKCRYILATGIGRSVYLFAVAFASFLIVAALLMIAFLVAAFKTPEIFDISLFSRLILFSALIALNVAICVFFSKLLFGRWGTGAAIFLIVFTGVVDPNPLNHPLVRSIISTLKILLPWESRAIERIGNNSLDGWLIVVSQIIAFTLTIGFVANYIFQKKELIFDEE
jgi:predicted neutral ceramidase superfamily lipid hydrolase